VTSFVLSKRLRLTTGNERTGTMNVTAIVQARMGSARLPGKVLMDLGGETVLGCVVQRLRRASRISEVVVATSERVENDRIAGECDRLGVSCFRGSENDVLDRYLRAATHFRSDVIVRVTSDCPLIDPAVADEVVSAFFDGTADLACNDLPCTFPRGLDVEVFSPETLRRAEAIATKSYQREHVTPVIYERPDLFRIASVCGEQDFSQYRWTLDTAEDLQLIREIYAHFENRQDFCWQHVIELMQHRPELAHINAHVVQKTVTAGASLA